MDWQDFPKTELHLHLEGAAPPEFIQAKAREKGVDISLALDGENYIWADFPDFLKTYEEVMKVLRTPEDFYDLTMAVLAAQAHHGVRYTEIFLGEKLMCDHDAALWQEMQAAIEAASARAEAELGIIARYITVIVRHFGVEDAMVTAQIAAQFPSPRFTGFGMAGAEDFLRPQDFAPAFAIAREAGLGLTCHAGEWEGPLRIEETINSLGVSRIGHGVRASESPETLALLRDQNIHCEVCPGSNIALGAYSSWQTHPISQMRDFPISLSISTDDPPYFWTNMTNEYQKLSEIGWQKEDFIKTNQNAMAHAFCDQATRDQILKLWSNDA